MPFTNNIDTSQPTGTENANTIDDIIRNVRLQMKERFDSLTTGADIDPMRLRAGAIPSGYTIDSPNITGTPTGNFINYQRSVLSSASVSLGTSGSLPVTSGFTSIITLSLTAGTWLITGNFRLSISSSGTTSAQIRIFNSINATVTDAMISTNVTSFTGPFSFSQLLTLAGSATVTLGGIAFTGNTASIQGSTSNNADTSLTAIKVA